MNTNTFLKTLQGPAEERESQQTPDAAIRTDYTPVFGTIASPATNEQQVASSSKEPT